VDWSSYQSSVSARRRLHGLVTVVGVVGPNCGPAQQPVRVPAVPPSSRDPPPSPASPPTPATTPGPACRTSTPGTGWSGWLPLPHPQPPPTPRAAGLSSPSRPPPPPAPPGSPTTITLSVSRTDTDPRKGFYLVFFILTFSGDDTNSACHFFFSSLRTDI